MKLILKLPSLRRKDSVSGGRKPRRGAAEPAPRSSQRSNGARRQGATRTAPATEKRQPAGGRLRWLERVFILVGVGVVLAGGLKAWIALQGMPVEQIKVTGELGNVRTGAIREMVAPQLVHGLIGTDLAELSGHLEALPWVYRATVRRVWPNTLEIHIDEQLPIARWGDRGFLNHQGQIFRPGNEARWQALPLLDGPDSAAPELMRTYQRMVDLLTPLGLGLAQLSMDERGEVAAVLQGGQQLLIGGHNFLDRLQRFSSVYRAELVGEMERVERIDLRYAHGVAVAFAAPVETDVVEGTGEAGKV